MRSSSLIILLISEDIGQPTLATVLTVRVVSHEDPSSTLLSWTLPSHPPHLTTVFHTVVLEHEHRDFIVRVLDLLGSGVVLLLPLLGSPQPEHQVQGGLLLDVVVRQCPTVLQ